jgi:hypothetical protein
MRLRFAMSGHAANAQAKSDDEITPSKDETVEPPETTNDKAKIEAATGS